LLTNGLTLPEVLVLDGGLATELERRGCNVSGTLWSARVLLDRPDAVEATHLDYLLSGADCITTASYQVSFEGFTEAGLTAADATKALETSVAVAKAARARASQRTGRQAWIAASLGPYGAILHNGSEYHGRYDIAFDDLVAFHRSRLIHLHRAGVDLIAAETIPSLMEAQAILEALTATPDLPAWFAFTCADESHTAHGETLDACAQLLDQSPQAVAIGINCTAPHLVSSLIDRVRSSTQKPILVYPNSGEQWDAEARAWVGRADVADYSALACEWYARGARWIGGCCRTTPAHIAQVRAALKPNV
jgi:homocysteine S-methyltransferase